MDMSVITASQNTSLASLQSAISMTMLDKSLNSGSSEMSAMLTDFQGANPVASPSFGHKLDTYA